MSYAQKLTREQIEYARGRFFVKPKPPYVEMVHRPLRPLSAMDKDKVALNRAEVLEFLPEAEPFIKELFEAGMIDGWRGVGDVVVHEIKRRS